MNNNKPKKEIPYLTKVYRQINDMIMTESLGSDLIHHPLYKGLSNEEIIRENLRKILPKRYGIGKGKVANELGELSKQCDVIIYDSQNCPTLFLDNNMNQVLPIEGVYAVIEVKTKLTKSKVKESFEQIFTVKNLLHNHDDVSTNDLIQIIPPLGYVIAFNDNRSLKTLYNNYITINKKYNRHYRSLSYSKKSPGYGGNHINRSYLIDSIVVINKGIIHYMYSGTPVLYPCGVDSIGIFIISLAGHLEEMQLNRPSLSLYYEGTLWYDQLTKTKAGFVIHKSSLKTFEKHVHNEKKF